jgi:hypothetical protein
MLGRPNTWLPVFMKICPGAWLNCVVCTDRTIATSSAIVASCGSSSDSSAPDSPYRLNVNGDPSSRGVPLMNANRSPLGMNSAGISWPSNFWSAGLLSNRSSCVGAPAMKR